MCEFCDCLKLLIKDSGNTKYSIALVQEHYDNDNNFRGQAKYGGYELHFCPECGEIINISTLRKKIKGVK